MISCVTLTPYFLSISQILRELNYSHRITWRQTWPLASWSRTSFLVPRAAGSSPTSFSNCPWQFYWFTGPKRSVMMYCTSTQKEFFCGFLIISCFSHTKEIYLILRECPLFWGHPLSFLFRDRALWQMIPILGFLKNKSRRLNKKLRSLCQSPVFSLYDFYFFTELCKEKIKLARPQHS